MDTDYGRHLAEKVSGTSLNDIGTSNYSMFQVMKAVEAAEVTIKQQVDENNRLRNELIAKSQVVERLMKSYERISDEGFQSLSPNVAIDYSPAYSNSSRNRTDIVPTAIHLESPSTNSNVNGSLKLLNNRPSMENIGISHNTSPSTSFSPKSDHDTRSNITARGMIQVADGSNSKWKQEKEYEEEIAQLRNYLSEFSKKEGQIRSEKYALEKRISFMRMAFDQQQQDLVDAASKALSYRQDIIEENVRLTYELQAAQQERSTFVSSLLPLLEDYSLQPVVPDAQSIISNIRILFKHLQEKLNHTEAKLKEFEYLSLPWHHQDANLPNSPLRLSHHVDVDLTKGGLDMVPQPNFVPAKVPVSPGNAHTGGTWDFQKEYRSGVAGAISKNLENHGGRYSPFGSSAHMAHESPGQFTPIRDEMPDIETTAVESNFGKMMITSDSDHLNGENNDRTMIPPYPTSMNDQTLYSPYLPPVLEEPTSSFSEAADDDPLPAIRDLQISGEAFPGRELQACGFSINGTTSCNFEWVRHLEDGSVNYIEGAKQPTYLVTADDVQAYLAIEVQPLDDRKRKGELVKVFANDHRKIACDPDMQSLIEKHLYSANVSFRVALSTGFLDIWEPAILTIKKDSYSVKCTGPSGIIVTDKFTPNSNIMIPYGQPSEFVISTSSETNHLLRENSTDLESSRDLIVLTFRLFMIRANQKRKGRKRLFFMK